MHTYAIYFHYYNHINPDFYKFDAIMCKELQRGTFKKEQINDFDYLVFGLHNAPNKYLESYNLKLLKEFELSNIYVFEVINE